MRGLWLAALAATIAVPIGGKTASAAQPDMPAIVSIKDRAAVQDRWIAERLDTVIPEIMRETRTDMWIVIAGEYNEDPVARTMLPATWLNARRRTILVFFDDGGKNVERIALARYPVDNFTSEWDPDRQEDQWKRLAELIVERNPRTIAVNMSEHFPLADGMTASHLQAIQRALPADMAKRIAPTETLAIGWLERRIAGEITTYPQLSRITHAIIEEAFSERVVTPGVTTSDDLVWWFRQTLSSLGLATWFHPSVAIQRDGSGSFGVQEMGLRGDTVIMPGDMLHVDFGIDYLGLKTDVQRVAYVLREGETEAPKGLREGLAAMNAVKDALLAELKPGRSGDAILAAARRRIDASGIDGTIYSHPLGFHGHGAGTWIGAWERQDRVPHLGAHVVKPNTAWSIELNAQHDVAEWGGQKVRFMYEENGHLDGEGRFHFFDGTQDEFILLPQP